MKFALVLALMLCASPLMNGFAHESSEEGSQISFYDDYYGSRRRPFNWYYPYSYEYYYPRRNSGNACGWVYTYEGYVYRCW